MVKMWLSGCALLLVACTVNAPTEENDQPITGGKIDQTHPAVVALVEDDADGKTGTFFCTGTLIRPDIVLTAAHCLVHRGERSLHIARDFRAPPSFTSFGRNHFATSRMVQVIGRAIPKKYSDTDPQLLNDYAVLRVKTPIAGVTPMALRRTPIATGMQVALVGFGLSEGPGVEKIMPLLAQSEIASVKATQFVGALGADTCSGDSGGPALVREGIQEVVAGITSFGPADCTGGGTYTRVDVFHQAIESAIVALDR